MRHVTLVAGLGATTCEDSVVLLRAGDWDEALARAIQLGESKCHRYVSANGADVRIAFVAAITLDPVTEPLDGAQLSVRRTNPPIELSDLTFEASFEPWGTTPDQTL